MREIDQGTLVDDGDGDIDVELDGNNHLDLDSEHNDDNLESIYSTFQRIELALQRTFSDPQLFQKLENTNLLHSSPPLEFFKLFITDYFVSKMAEQTNF